ncbi:unnamed protein product [Microthlaspi erraticum]|uniref:F-box domain-containing protein n=1 Tax=Microthlaspi erraticum TaxID=1685480 RepID=A0A6D2INK9_9BRAS|nr:unnamed protein product [Microthlaspi erraticum]
MANMELPWDLIEEILSRVPPQSLARFRTVSKRWNALFDDKMFINNHKSTFRFILATKSKFYSVSVNPKVEVRELTLDIPGLESQAPKKLIDCNGLLLCEIDKGARVWNPWSKQTRWIEPDADQPGLQSTGIGYDKDNGYKTLTSCNVTEDIDHPKTSWKVHHFSTDAWKNINGVLKSPCSTTTESEVATFHTTRGFSLNGTWYRVAHYHKTINEFFLIYFDFSTETFHKFCDLPWEGNRDCDALVLRVYNGDRFSLLKQCHLTKKIEILVTKNKIQYSGGDVEWVSFMEVSIPKLPDLLHKGYHYQPSYFIDDKRLAVCFLDETARACIYVMEENELISKTQLESVVGQWPLHCTFSPSLVSVPQLQREEAELND